MLTYSVAIHPRLQPYVVPFGLLALKSPAARVRQVVGLVSFLPKLSQPSRNQSHGAAQGYRFARPACNMRFCNLKSAPNSSPPRVFLAQLSGNTAAIRTNRSRLFSRIQIALDQFQPSHPSQNDEMPKVARTDKKLSTQSG